MPQSHVGTATRACGQEAHRVLPKVPLADYTQRSRENSLITRLSAVGKKSVREGEAPTGHGHAASFMEGGARVRGELKGLLIQHDLKTAAREWHGVHIAVPPFNRDAGGWGMGTGHLQHAGVEVHADDVPKVAISLNGHSGDNTRPKGPGW
jgi:hypothetical protein